MVARHRILTRVDLSGCEQTTDGWLECLASSLLQLTELSVSRCLRVTDAGVAAVGKHCAALRSFECEGCLLVGDVGCSALVRGCSLLERLSVRACVGISSKSFLDVSRLARMQHLNLGGLRLVSSEALARVAAGCTGLQLLNLGMCPGANDSVVQMLAQRCGHLRGLGLHATGVTDTGLAALGKGLTVMEELDLGHCKRISDRGVCKVAAGCTALQRLSLDGCAVLGEEAVTMLADRCAGMQVREKFLLCARGC